MAKSKAQKRTEADARQQAYDALSHQDKVLRAKKSRGNSAKVLKKLRKAAKS